MGNVDTTQHPLFDNTVIVDDGVTPHKGDNTFDTAFPLPAASKSGRGSTGQGTGSSSRMSRDEMNLAEFPLTVLSKRVDPSIKTLEFNDSVRGKNGEVVQRAWIITGADKFGLPTSSDDEVLIGLLKLTADGGVQNRKIYFTRYELLKILRWTTEGRSYSRLQNALDRLSGVRIKATNAFYDNETKLHSTRNFGIIDAYEINDGRDTRPSFFTWSDVLFKSFQVGFIKKLDLEFYLDLKSAVSKRLYRYLDKHFWYRSRVQINLFTLAHEKIGISRNYVYASSLRQQIEPALDELVQQGMLAEYEFTGRGQSTEVVLLAAQGPRKGMTAAEGSNPSKDFQAHGAAHQATHRGTASHDGAHNRGEAMPTAAQVSDPYEDTIRELVGRGIAEKQARRVINDRSERALQRVRDIVLYFDSLVATKSHLVTRSPCGFLYRAIERPFEFVLPNDRNGERRAEKLSGKSSSVETTSHHAPKPNGPVTQEVDRGALEARYLTARKQAAEAILQTGDTEEIQMIRAQVEAALSKLRAHISPQRFAEALQHGIEQRLLDNHKFPDFEKWSRDFRG